jgi:hypothetical protein
MARRGSSLAQLDAALIAAHAAGDAAEMARLYHEAADALAGDGVEDEVAFFLTQAYVLSLDCGDHERAHECHRWLKAMGREA